MNVKATEITPRKWDNDLTEEQKIELFLEINELGTKMSEEHLKNIKEKYLKKQLKSSLKVELDLKI